MNSTIYSQIGLRVRQLRRQQHRSQDELSVWLRAFHAPITRDMIANWETGRAVVPAVYIPVLAYALKVEVADILPGLTLKDLKAGQIMPSVPPSARAAINPVKTGRCFGFGPTRTAF